MTAALPSNEEFLTRFWDHIIVQGYGVCWPTTYASYNKHGHAQIKIGGGKRLQMHVVAYCIYNGLQRTPEEMVLHSCNNGGCCNPSHLRLGSHRDNMQDMVNSGRHPNQVKTTCPKGHDYQVYGRLTSTGSRICRECDRLRRAT